MSGNPELTPEVLAEPGATLLRRQADLQRLIADLPRLIADLPRSVSAPADPLDNVGGDAHRDAGDSSVDLQDREDTNEPRLVLQAQLNEVEHALTRFEDGTYGICERCGRPIPLARPRVLPEGRYDVEYEEDVEAGRMPR